MSDIIRNMSDLFFAPWLRPFVHTPDKLKNEAEFLYNKEGDMWLYKGGKTKRIKSGCGRNSKNVWYSVV